MYYQGYYQSPARQRAIRIPSARLEYGYYFAVVYSVMAPAVGLEIPAVAGALILAVWVICIFRLRAIARELFAPLLPLIACGASFIVLQIGVHGESLLDADIRAFITWIMGLMIVRSLLLRPGFCIHFPFVLLGLGFAALPFVGFNSGEVDMARVDLAVGGGLTHPAGFANWFGFCAVFLAVFGVEARQPIVRISAWTLMTLCLFLVALSVERGPLFATLLGLILAFRRSLKRGFLPLFVLTLFACVISFTGAFEQATSNYFQRGFEDTGREILWPEALERIWAAPVLGEGKSDAVIYLQGTKFAQPHNSFLYFALSSGIIPVLFFAAFWVRTGWRTVFRFSTYPNAAYSLPYLAFIVPALMLNDTGFMSMGGLLIGSFLAHATAKRSQFAIRTSISANMPVRRSGGFRPIVAQMRYGQSRGRMRRLVK